MSEIDIHRQILMIDPAIYVIINKEPKHVSVVM